MVLTGMGRQARSKAEARRRIKEHWFDVGVAAFERVFPEARAKTFPELEDPYICPLCSRPFVRSALLDGTLTFEDAPPRSYGGKPIALTCKRCNNSLGSSLDGPLSMLDSAEMSPCRLGIGGVEVNAYQQIRDGGRSFAIPQNQNDPNNTARFFEGLDATPDNSGSLQLTYKHDPDERRRADIAWLKAAYLVTFARWGYSYAFFPALQIVRAQLAHPGDEIIRQFKLEKRSSPRDTRFLIMVREPPELRGVAVGMGQHTVLLPTDGRDMSIYERLESALRATPTLRFVGDTYHWPVAPTHSIDVTRFDSLLALPTPGEVRALT
jgi:hypothetical protein